MRRDYVLWNLKEAAEAIEEIVRDMEADPDYTDVELSVDLTHLYHHVNTAWNARHASESQIAECSEDDFRRWRAFPADIDMGV